MRRLAAPLVLLLLIVGFYWKLSLTGQYTWLESPDLAHMDLPRFQFQAVDWNQGRFPLWNPHSWLGQPWLGQVSGGANPLIWLLAKMPLRADGLISDQIINRWYVLVHVLAALFCYALCRELRCSRIASVAGGLIFSASGFVGNIDWPQVLTGAIWAPLVFLFLFRAVSGSGRAWSSAALSGMFLGLSWLSGHHEVPIYLTFAWGFTWLFFLLRDLRGRTLLFAVSILFLALTSAFQVIPGWEYGQHAVRWVGVDQPVGWNASIPYMVHEQYSLTPSSILGIAFPGLYRNANPFLGLIGVVLVVLAITAWWQKPPVKWLSCLALAALLASMAQNNVFHGLLYVLAPVFGKARVPARLLVVFSLAVAPLAAMGLDVLLEKTDAVRVKRAGYVLLAVGALVFSFALGMALVQKYEPAEKIVLSGAIGIGAGSLLLAASRGAIRGAALLTLLGIALFIELGHGLSVFLRNKNDKVLHSYLAGLRATKEIAGFLKKQPQPLRVNVDSSVVPANFGDYWGIDVTSSFGASITENIWRLEMHSDRTQDLAGTGYAIQKEPTREGQVALYEAANGLKVFRNPNALPRCWTVHETKPYKDPEELRLMIQDRAFPLREIAPVSSPVAGLEKCGGADQVTLTTRFSNQLTMDANLACAGMVVISETWFPGWRASVDGKEAPLHEVYGALRGVVVPAGQHHIEMVYRPKTALLGAILSALGVLGAAALVLWDRLNAVGG